MSIHDEAEIERLRADRDDRARELAIARLRMQGMESVIQDQRAKMAELEGILEQERKVHLRIAMHADRVHLQMQAIRDAALGELCGIIADGPENLEGLQERE